MATDKLDPFAAFHTPANAQVVPFLLSHAEFVGAENPPTWWKPDGYSLHTHPDALGWLDEVAERVPDCETHLIYGYGIIASEKHTIVAVSYLMYELELRLGAVAAQASAENEFRPSVIGPDWVQVKTFNTGERTDWVEVLAQSIEQAVREVESRSG